MSPLSTWPVMTSCMRLSPFFENPLVMLITPVQFSCCLAKAPVLIGGSEIEVNAPLSKVRNPVLQKLFPPLATHLKAGMVVRQMSGKDAADEFGLFAIGNRPFSS